MMNIAPLTSLLPGQMTEEEKRRKRNDRWKKGLGIAGLVGLAAVPLILSRQIQKKMYEKEYRHLDELGKKYDGMLQEIRSSREHEGGLQERMQRYRDSVPPQMTPQELNEHFRTVFPPGGNEQ